MQPLPAMLVRGEGGGAHALRLLTAAGGWRAACLNGVPPARGGTGRCPVSARERMEGTRRALPRLALEAGALRAGRYAANARTGASRHSL